MKICELLDNDEFTFDARYRIYEYKCSEIGSEEEGESILKFDSEKDFDFDYSLNWQSISAINQAEDGAVEIEYVELL